MRTCDHLLQGTLPYCRPQYKLFNENNFAVRLLYTKGTRAQTTSTQANWSFQSANDHWLSLKVDCVPITYHQLDDSQSQFLLITESILTENNEHCGSLVTWTSSKYHRIRWCINVAYEYCMKRQLPNTTLVCNVTRTCSCRQWLQTVTIFITKRLSYPNLFIDDHLLVNGMYKTI